MLSSLWSRASLAPAHPAARRFIARLRSGADIHQIRKGEPNLIRKTGIDIVHDPLLNKGTAFSVSERDRLHLRGLIPPRLNKMKQQIQRVMQAFHEAPNDVAK